MHEMTVTDDTGDTIDALPFCSDACHRDYAGTAYEGWSGAHETEFTTWCVACGVVIVGVSPDDDLQPCAHQTSNVIVNRFRSADGEQCEHGHWIQVPDAYLVAYNR